MGPFLETSVNPSPCRKVRQPSEPGSKWLWMFFTLAVLLFPNLKSVINSVRCTKLPQMLYSVLDSELHLVVAKLQDLLSFMIHLIMQRKLSQNTALLDMALLKSRRQLVNR